MLVKILIVNAYVRENKGDAALIAVIAKQLQNIFPKATIAISGMENSKKYPDFYGFKNLSSLQRYAVGIGASLPLRIMHLCIIGIIGAIWPVLPFRTSFTTLLPSEIQEELSAIEEADMIVSASGGYLSGGNSLFENFHIYFDVLPLRLAERLGKMVMMAPGSFGPFGNDWQRTMVRKTLNAARLVFVREHKSYDLLKGIGVQEDRMVQTVDSGFAHEGPLFKHTSETRDKIYVGITARNWLTGEKQKKYESALARFIINIEKQYGAESILIPQVTSGYNTDDDRIVEKRIKDLAVQGGAHPVQVIDEIDHNEIKKIYSQCTFVVGTRLHSVIFSLTSYVPSIAIEYEHKTSGIMHDLNLNDWVIKIEDVTTEKLNELFARLVAEQKSYRKHLTMVLPPYIARTNEVPRLIKQVYEKRIG